MKNEPAVVLIGRFSYNHFETDGRLENVLDVLEEIDAEGVCLAIWDGSLDEVELTRAMMSERLGRVRKVVARLRRRGISSQLAIPGISPGRLGEAGYKRDLSYFFGGAAETGVQIVWLDDAVRSKVNGAAGPGEALVSRENLAAFAKKTGRSVSGRRLLNILAAEAGGSDLTRAGETIKRDWLRFARQSYLGLARAAQRAVDKRKERVRVGLLAAPAECYEAFGVTQVELAEALAGSHRPLLGPCQSFREDYGRTEILQAAQAIAVAEASCERAAEVVERVGAVENQSGSPFHKSAEAMQMQINLNIFYGARVMLLDCFGAVGSDPGGDNIYLGMQDNNETFLRKLGRLLASDAEHCGVGVVVPDGPGSLNGYRSWMSLLGRMGLPLRVVSGDGVTGDMNGERYGGGPYVLVGDSARGLKKRQLNHIFRQGVLLDGEAAQTIQEMGRGDLLGVEMGGSVEDVQTEILTDMRFGARYFGRRTLFGGRGGVGDFRRVRVTDKHARQVTTLMRRGKAAGLAGMVLFDDDDHGRRCAIMPYRLSDAGGARALLNLERRVHLHDVLCWLNRARLGCYVENSADLAPFYMVSERRKRIVLALLNVGFDWSIDARIRLGKLPFKVKRVRELDEQGKVLTDRQLRVTHCIDYDYIQLTDETAVAPMQMTILLVEG